MPLVKGGFDMPGDYIRDEEYTEMKLSEAIEDTRNNAEAIARSPALLAMYTVHAARLVKLVSDIKAMAKEAA